MIFRSFFILFVLAFDFCHASSRFYTDFSWSSSTFEPKIACCGKGLMYDDSAPIAKVIISDSTIPELNRYFEIPFVTKKLKINRSLYSAPEVLRIVDIVRSDIMHALQNNIRVHKDTLQMDWVHVKQILSLDDFSKYYMNGSLWENFFSSINVNLVKCKNSKRDSILETFNILPLNGRRYMIKIVDDNWQNVVGDSLSLEFKIKADSQLVDLGAIKKNSEITAIISFDFKISKKDDSISVVTNFKSFDIEYPRITAEITNGWPLHVKDECLKVSITKDGVQDNLELDEGLSFFIFKPYGNFELLDEVDVPFLDMKSFSVGGANYSLREIVDTIKNYVKIIDNAAYDAYVEPDILELSKMKAPFDSVIYKTIPLGNVAVLNHSLYNEKEKYSEKDFLNLYGNSTPETNGSIRLHKDRNVLVYRFSPKSIKILKTTDFGVFKVDNFDVELNLYYNHVVEMSDEPFGSEYFCVVFASLTLDRIEINLTAKNRTYYDVDIFHPHGFVDEKVNSMDFDVGLFKAKLNIDFKNRNELLHYNVSIDPKSLESIKNVRSVLYLEPDSLTLKTGDLIVKTLNKDELKGGIRYDANRGEWILPSSLKRFASFTSDDLLKQVYAISNSLRELRNHVEGRAKSEYSSESGNEVSKAIEAFDHVVFNKDSGHVVNGFVDESGRYHHQKFRVKRRDALLEYENGKYHKRFCDFSDFARKFSGVHGVDVSFLDANKKEISVVDKRLNGKIAYVKVSFNLNFNLRPDFALEFAKILRSRLTDLPTESRVQVDKKSNVLFEFVADLRK